MLPDVAVVGASRSLGLEKSLPALFAACFITHSPRPDLTVQHAMGRRAQQIDPIAHMDLLDKAAAHALEDGHRSVASADCWRASSQRALPRFEALLKGELAVEPDRRMQEITRPVRGSLALSISPSHRSMARQAGPAKTLRRSRRAPGQDLAPGDHL
jgi:hypothetical protein